eukprot:3123252-Rhodomonas_salina.1
MNLRVGALARGVLAPLGAAGAPLRSPIRDLSTARRIPRTAAQPTSVPTGASGGYLRAARGARASPSRRSS